MFSLKAVILTHSSADGKREKNTDQFLIVRAVDTQQVALVSNPTAAVLVSTALRHQHIRAAHTTVANKGHGRTTPYH